jgi:putative restriction endonuclease
MKAWVGITDFDWYRQLAARPELDEVNFWQPSGGREFGVLQPGELFLFKLHAPRRSIVGGGFFAHATRLPLSLAWDAFAEKNGAQTLHEMRTRVERYRKAPAEPHGNYIIGCILLEQPFFLPERLWIPEPPDWHANTVQGKSYDLQADAGRALWHRVEGALHALRASGELPSPLAEIEARFGEPRLFRPRLGQASFRILVTDAYDRRCAITDERVLPVLEAAHIKPYASGGEHQVDNGLLLRSDLHTLFDRGYLTVTPDLQLEVSRRIRDDFDNGRHYYALHGRRIRIPGDPTERPSGEFLRWHNEEAYLG